MYISGSVVHVQNPIGGVDYGYIASPKYDDVMLLMEVEAYNDAHGTNYTIDQMKEAYDNQSDMFNEYKKWHENQDGGAKATKFFADIAAEMGKSSEEIYNMSIEELEAYMEGR